MRGKVHLTVQSVHLKYEMEFVRNITILKGDSATGKTTLVDMIREYDLNGSDTGINLSCDVPCRVVEGSTWKEQLDSISGSLVFIDEGNRFVSSEEFARGISNTDNYYVIVTRESLSNLPYSVTEIYGIHSSGRYAYQEPVYHHLYRIYGEIQPVNLSACGRLIVEDSGAGFELFDGLLSKKSVECVSAQGAGNIFGLLQQASVKNSMVVIADGAAFGAHMEKVYRLALKRHNIQLYLPESFEWLILSSGVLNDREIKAILDDPSEYIESRNYISWERYFTDLLIKKTSDSYLRYSKSRLNPVYLQDRICQQIVRALPEGLRNSLGIYSKRI